MSLGTINDMIYRTFNDAVRISIFSKISTNNPIIDTILSTIILTTMSYIIKIAYENNFTSSLSYYSIYNIKDSIKSLLYKKNVIVIEGKKCIGVNNYSSQISVSSIFSDRFKAAWFNIINNINDNNSIYEIKEFVSVFNLYVDGEKNKTNSDIFIVSQKTPFVFCKELKIYATTDVISEDGDNTDKSKSSTKTDKINIVLYSYTASLVEMKTYLDKITSSYIETIEKARNNKKYIYTLTKTTYSDDKYECWSEHPFESSRTFDNMFFEHKQDIIDKITFFLNNRKWYYDMGIPYTLGIGLHGPPGTGKTSLVKCLANLTGRHIITLSLKIIKTKGQLIDFFFEDRYNSNNKKNSVGFSDKIVFIDDIDCISDIVKKRHLDNSTIRPVNTLSMEDVLKTIVDSNNDSSKIMSTSLKHMDEEPITLDDILDLWDGIKETPGRILCIATNHWDQLDPALIRPGRIDISLLLSNASHNTISIMFQKYYNKPIDEDKLKKISEGFYSPAEIINVYIMYKDDSDKFMERLMTNVKI